MPTVQTSGTKLSMGCGYAVFLFLLAGGLALLAAAANNYQRHGGMTKDAIVPGVMGIVLLGGPLAYLGFARRLVRENRAEQARRAQFPDQPWKWKKEWIGPAIEPNEGAATFGLWFFALFWNALAWAGAVALFVKGIHKPGEYFIFLFPLIGVFLLWGAIYRTVRTRKFGRVRFVPSSLPGVIGGYLGGVIDVPARVTPEGDATLTLKCVRRETRGSGKNRRTTDVGLWEREESIPRQKWVTGSGGTRLPVLFYIPPTCVATDGSDSDNEIVWRLSAGAAVPGVDFFTQFEVPVFATGDTAAPPETGAPVLPEYRATPLDAAGLLKCGVRREGGAFHFSASHLPGTKIVTGGLQLGLLGLLGWFVGRDIPLPVWGITLFLGLLLTAVTFSVWFDQHELRIEGADVVITKPRPWGTKVTRVPRAEVAGVQSARSMATGNTQYYRLELVGALGVNPAAAGREGEPFATRKLRYQLAQAEKGQGERPRAELLAELKNAPKFVVPFAGHIPGQAKAEAIGEMVLKEIRGK
ncbi:MAG TPA: hypothetical protein VG734_21050 [Lacunisphaera sp.]|nr:hypothetical protein [Lacunisphaera sp.]